MLINKTQHPITIRLGEDESVIIPPTLPAARLSVTTTKIGEVDGVPIFKNVLGEIENLPETDEFDSSIVYIVSLLVAQKAMRADVLSPDSGPTAIRENGQIVAVRGLISQ